MSVKNEFVVYVPAQDGKFKISRVPFGMSEQSLTKHTLSLEGGESVQLGRVAFLHIAFADASSKQEAVDIARVRKLAFIPENILAGMRKRNPNVTMVEICAEFAARVEAYNKPQAEQPQASNDAEKDEIESLRGFLGEDVFKMFGDMFGGAKGPK